MRALAQYIMRGRMQAMLVAVAMAFLSLVLPPMNYLSSAVIGLVTLRRGWQEGLIIVVGAGAVMALFTLATPLNPIYAALFAAVVWLPVWLLSLLLRATVSLPATVTAAGLLGIVGVGLTYLALDDPARAWQDTLSRMIEKSPPQAGGKAPDMLSDMLAQAAPHMTGMAVAALVLGLLLSLLLARWWQALLYNPGGFRSEFHSLRLGRDFAVIALAVLLVNVLTADRLQEVAANMIIVVVAVYLLPGMSLLHGVVAAKGAHTAWLAGVYVLGVFVLPQLALLLATLAFADSWVDFRSRLTRKHGPGGDDI